MKASKAFIGTPALFVINLYQCSGFIIPSDTTTVAATPTSLTISPKPQDTLNLGTATKTSSKGWNTAVASALAEEFAQHGGLPQRKNEPKQDRESKDIGELLAMMSVWAWAKDKTKPTTQTAQIIWPEPGADIPLTGSGPASDYDCWSSHIRYSKAFTSYMNASKNFSLTTKTWTEPFSLQKITITNPLIRSITRLCDGYLRLFDEPTTTVGILTSYGPVVRTRIEKAPPRPSCSLKWERCSNLHSVYSKFTYSILSSAAFKHYTEMPKGEELPVFQFRHLEPPCFAAPKCPSADKLITCDLLVRHATLFYWPETTSRDVCISRNQLASPTQPPMKGSPPATATFESMTITSPSPVIILRGLQVRYAPQEPAGGMDWLISIRDRENSLAKAKPLVTTFHNDLIGVWAACGPEARDATLQLAPKDFTSMRVSYEPKTSSNYLGQEVLVHEPAYSLYPLDFQDLWPPESIPWDALAGQMGCNTAILSSSLNAVLARQNVTSVESSKTPSATSTQISDYGQKRVDILDLDPHGNPTSYYFGDDSVALEAWGRCPNAIRPNHYTPLVQMPKEAINLDPEYKLCNGGSMVYIAQMLPITDSIVRLPVLTEWVATYTTPSLTSKTRNAPGAVGSLDPLDIFGSQDLLL